jgi:hypothetical protein
MDRVMELNKDPSVYEIDFHSRDAMTDRTPKALRNTEHWSIVAAVLGKPQFVPSFVK